MATTKPLTPFPPQEKYRVLILGCGNSTFGHDMIQDGFGHITNVDFSSTVIEQMKTKYSGFSDFMNFVCVDVTKGLPFVSKSFDLIICKGTFDALLTSAGSIANAKFVVSECSRVLANGHGVLFLVSYGNPDSRVVFLERDNDLSYYWQEVSIHTVSRRSAGSAKNDYVYVCSKRLEDVPFLKGPQASSCQTMDRETSTTEMPLMNSTARVE